MKMNVTRTLHPIGQGAFYTEKFEYEGQQCNVVFDCGGTEKFIEKEVRQTQTCSYKMQNQGRSWGKRKLMKGAQKV